ncbi:MAG: hypothetical protein OSB21_06725, partial [Myxococcota bacterium]|nr:hypothetical protein [Myxococcota bacterium]
VVYPFMFQRAVQVKKAKIGQRNEQLAPGLHRQRNIAFGVTALGSALAVSGWLLEGPDGQQISGLLLSGVAVMGVGIGGILWTQLK